MLANSDTTTCGDRTFKRSSHCGNLDLRCAAVQIAFVEVSLFLFEAQDAKKLKAVRAFSVFERC